MSFSYSKDLTDQQRDSIQRKLLAWGAENYRAFPWREQGVSAYEVLLSECLLRKTRANSVVPVYTELVTRYPDVTKLSRARVSTLERIVRPLGLHKIRSKALKDLATKVVKEHDGEIPLGEESLAGLPHCGRYTANAVLCFYAQEDRALVDSNIERFLCRHFGFEPVIEIHKADDMWEFMQGLLPSGCAREFNYALLDYCALVCTSRKCLCGAEIGEM